MVTKLSAKGEIIKDLKQKFLTGKITASEHQDYYDKLKKMEEGHDIHKYIKMLYGETE